MGLGSAKPERPTPTEEVESRNKTKTKSDQAKSNRRHDRNKAKFGELNPRTVL